MTLSSLGRGGGRADGRAGSGAAGGATDGAGTGSSPAGAARSNETTFDERGVSSPATVASQPVAVYPPEARAAQIETDVPVDIVVDKTGHVVEARVAKPAGYGLDDAALETVRRTRFHPAERDGRTVAVRMRWTMQFRLN